MSLKASSIYNQNQICCRPQFAIDRRNSFHSSHGYYVSQTSMNPWFMITFGEKILLEQVDVQESYIPQKRITAPFKNITVRAGPELTQYPPDGSQILENDECVFDKTTGGLFKQFSFKCKPKVEAKIITIQKLSDTKVELLFEEVEIIGKGKNSTIFSCLD